MRHAFAMLALTMAMGLGAAAPAADVTTRPYAVHPLPTPETVSAWASAFKAETFVAPSGTRLPYRIYRPPGAHATRLPLVVVLHGSGAIGDDNVKQLSAFATAWADPAFTSRQRAIVVAPQAPSRTVDYAQAEDGLLAAHPGPALPAILALVDSLARDPAVDASRVYVTGFSMGASTALTALTLRPDRFAAAAVFASIPPPRRTARGVARIPVLMVHGDEDAETGIAPDKAWVEALNAAGGRPHLIVYEGMGHRVPDDMVADGGWRTWLLSQRRR